jgi:hypothetical protein
MLSMCLFRLVLLRVTRLVVGLAPGQLPVNLNLLVAVTLASLVVQQAVHPATNLRLLPRLVAYSRLQADPNCHLVLLLADPSCFRRLEIHPNCQKQVHPNLLSVVVQDWSVVDRQQYPRNYFLLLAQQRQALRPKRWPKANLPSCLCRSCPTGRLHHLLRRQVTAVMLPRLVWYRE